MIELKDGDVMAARCVGCGKKCEFTLRQITKRTKYKKNVLSAQCKAVKAAMVSWRGCSWHE